MSGPPPISFALRKLRGNPGKRRLHAEPEPQIARTCPEPPPFIPGYAADEWWLVAPELHRLGMLTVADVASLAAYCYAYGQWRLAAEALARNCEERKRRSNPSIPALWYGLLRFARNHEETFSLRQNNPTGKSPEFLSSPSAKNIPLNPSGKSVLFLRTSHGR
jgi:Phage terminase, small subunit